MMRFEEDLKNGQMVDVTNYLEEDDIDYSTKVSKIGNKLSNTVSNYRKSRINMATCTTSTNNYSHKLTS